MAQTMVNFRQDADVKKEMESICKELGFTPSIAYNMFARTVVRERRIPFELSLDPFYSESNKRALEESERQFAEGKIVERTFDELLALEDA